MPRTSHLILVVLAALSLPATAHADDAAIAACENAARLAEKLDLDNAQMRDTKACYAEVVGLREKCVNANAVITCIADIDADAEELLGAALGHCLETCIEAKNTHRDSADPGGVPRLDGDDSARDDADAVLGRACQVMAAIGSDHAIDEPLFSDPQTCREGLLELREECANPDEVLACVAQLGDGSDPNDALPSLMACFERCEEVERVLEPSPAVQATCEGHERRLRDLGANVTGHDATRCLEKLASLEKRCANTTEIFACMDAVTGDDLDATEAGLRGCAKACTPR